MELPRSAAHAPLSCTLSPPWGFLLLEEVELAFGSAQQEIRSLQLLRVLDEPCLAALASRELRQDGKMTRFLSAYFYPFYFLFHRVVL